MVENKQIARDALPGKGNTVRIMLLWKMIMLLWKMIMLLWKKIMLFFFIFLTGNTEQNCNVKNNNG